MRRIVKRVVKTVTTVTLTICWDEEVAGEDPEQTRRALPESQPSAKIIEPAESSGHLQT